ncbi:MAG: metalloprotease TldD [Legionellaceae bacterium]|nr:metalloprotease TldD [Legionellaceae bacterium]HCA89355.1 metalloprotease TldD [Legionellales bacterium]|tara:strand:- start:1356 stop:2801 length:1446 start_codon:yes stop_codon:yes gene_type:complete
MNEYLKKAQDIILKSSDLDENTIQNILHSMAGKNIDDADLYFQNCHYESWYLEDSEVKSGSFSIEKGVGLRVISGEKTGYAYCDDILSQTMKRAAVAAKSVALSASRYSQINAKKPIKMTPVYGAENPLISLNHAEKIALLESIDKKARSLDNRVVQVNASLNGCFEAVMIAGLQTDLIADIRPLVSINVSVIVEDAHGRRETARAGGGGRMTYSYFTYEHQALTYVQAAVREALINLEADDAPAGTMPVVLGPGWPGVLLHEAVGHGLEGDFNRKGLSAFSGKIGQQIAARGVYVVDDGTLKDRRGSLSIDDEGTPAQCTTLIEDGILVNYMQDKLNAKIMNMNSTGNCRRESYAHVPMPRMTNTYMLSGTQNPLEIIQSVEKGLYAVNFGGGQVDITSGQFVFSASEAYLIEKGKITRPVKGATLIGNGPDIMKKISMVGNDLSLDAGIGVCGKDGQSVPVGVGQPTLKIDALTVGGTR